MGVRAVRPQLLFIAPVMPDVTGSGTPMRAGVFLEALSKQYDVHLLVVTMIGAGSADAVPDFVRAHSVRVSVYQGLLQGMGAAIARLRSGAASKGALADDFIAFTKVARASAALLDRPSLARYATDAVVEAALAPLLDRQYDVVHVLRSYMTPFAERFLEASNGHRPTCVLDLDDDESEKCMRMSALHSLTGDRTSADREAAEARRYLAFEERTVRRFDRALVCSSRDRDVVAARHDLETIAVVPNSIRVPVNQNEAGMETRWSFLFVGSLSYFPNIDAVRLFYRDILPRIRERDHQEASFAVVGALAPGQLSRELSMQPNVTFVGRVPDPAEYYRGAMVSVVPLRAGGGTRIKLLESFAHGTPAVSTTLGAEGLDVVHDRHLLIADTPDAFADACVRLLGDRALRDRLASAAGQLVRGTYSLEAVATRIHDVFETACRTGQIGRDAARGRSLN